MVDESRHIFFALHLLLDDDVLELGAAVLPEVAEHQHLPALVIVTLPDLCVTSKVPHCYRCRGRSGPPSKNWAPRAWTP